MQLLAKVVVLANIACAAPVFSTSGDSNLAAGVAAPGTTGPYKSQYSTDPNLPKHTIYAPLNAPEGVKLPVLIWGNGGCSGDGTSFSQSLLQVASHGYLAIANGAPKGSGSTTAKMGTESLNWLDKYAGQGKWANVDKTRVAVGGQSCGGLEAYTVGTDKRIKTIGIMNSGQFSESATNTVTKTVTKPIFYFLGGSGDIAYKNGERDYKALRGVPRWKGNMAVGSGAAAHMATWRNVDGGKFAVAEIKWLDWLLKGDAKAKEFFTGGGAKADGWTAESADLDKIQ